MGRGARCWTILIHRKSGALLWVWQLQNMAGLQVIFGWNRMTHGSATENVWSWRQSWSKITSESSGVSYPESGRPNRSTPFWSPRVSLRRPWHQLQGGECALHSKHVPSAAWPGCSNSDLFQSRWFWPKADLGGTKALWENPGFLTAQWCSRVVPTLFTFWEYKCWRQPKSHIKKKKWLLF